jgi:hypothetical protein
MKLKLILAVNITASFIHFEMFNGSLGGSVGIATGYRLDDQGWGV